MKWKESQSIVWLNSFLLRFEKRANELMSISWLRDERIFLKFKQNRRSIWWKIHENRRNILFMVCISIKWVFGLFEVCFFFSVYLQTNLLRLEWRQWWTHHCNAEYTDKWHQIQLKKKLTKKQWNYCHPYLLVWLLDKIRHFVSINDSWPKMRDVWMWCVWIIVFWYEIVTTMYHMVWDLDSLRKNNAFFGRF